jgi:hypothetical protein
VARSRKIAAIFRRPIIVGIVICKRNAQLCNEACRFTYSSCALSMMNSQACIAYQMSKRALIQHSRRGQRNLAQPQIRALTTP